MSSARAFPMSRNSRKTDAMCIVHCLYHIIDQLYEIASDIIHGPSVLLEAGIGIAKNFSDHC